MDGRLARRAKHAPPQGILHQGSSRPPPTQDAAPDRSKKRPSLGTVGNIAAAWAEAYADRQPSKKIIARQLTMLAGHLPPTHLTPLHFTSLVAKWKHDLAPATVHTYAHKLRELAKFIESTTGITHIATWIPRTRDPGPRRVIASREEIDRLEATAPPWLRVVIVLARSLGWRLSEALRISASSLDPDDTITVRVKGGKEHTLPTTPNVAALFQHAPPGEPSTPLVERYRGSPVSVHTAHKAWRKLVARSGVNPHLNLHDLRRTAAVALYELTTDLRAVEHLLGHSQLSTTTRYLEHRDTKKLAPLLARMWTPKGDTRPQ